MFSPYEHEARPFNEFLTVRWHHRFKTEIGFVLNQFLSSLPI